MAIIGRIKDSTEFRGPAATPGLPRDSYRSVVSRRPLHPAADGRGRARRPHGRRPYHGLVARARRGASVQQRPGRTSSSRGTRARRIQTTITTGSSDAASRSSSTVIRSARFSNEANSVAAHFSPIRRPGFSTSSPPATRRSPATRRWWRHLLVSGSSPSKAATSL